MLSLDPANGALTVVYSERVQKVNVSGVSVVLLKTTDATQSEISTDSIVYVACYTERETRTTLTQCCFGRVNQTEVRIPVPSLDSGAAYQVIVPGQLFQSFAGLDVEAIDSTNSWLFVMAGGKTRVYVTM